MTKKEIADKSRRAFEKASRGEFGSRPLAPELLAQFRVRVEELRCKEWRI